MSVLVNCQQVTVLGPGHKVLVELEVSLPGVKAKWLGPGMAKGNSVGAIPRPRHVQSTEKLVEGTSVLTLVSPPAHTELQLKPVGEDRCVAEWWEVDRPLAVCNCPRVVRELQLKVVVVVGCSHCVAWISEGEDHATVSYYAESYG